MKRHIWINNDLEIGQALKQNLAPDWTITMSPDHPTWTQPLDAIVYLAHQAKDTPSKTFDVAQAFAEHCRQNAPTQGVMVVLLPFVPHETSGGWCYHQHTTLIPWLAQTLAPYLRVMGVVYTYPIHDIGLYHVIQTSKFILNHPALTGTLLTVSETLL